MYTATRLRDLCDLLVRLAVGFYHHRQYINVDSVRVFVCPSVTDVTQHDISFLWFQLRTGYVNGTHAPRIFWNVQLALSASDPLTQTSTNSANRSSWWPYLRAR